VTESCDGLSDVCPPDAVDPALCDDGNPCTSETCVALECQIGPVADGVLCTDADVCNGDETCQSGACSPGATLDCDDEDVCTADGCDAVSGCFHDPIPACQPGPAVPILSVGGILVLTGGIALAGAAWLRDRRATRP
jgi:hypothetical protein